MKLNKTTNILITIGTGGVGKTTLSAAIAIGQSYEGKKVLVITIDPSQRLAQALNFQPNGDIQEILLKKSPGQLYATTIDHKKVFLDFLKKGAQGKSEDDENIKKISENKLFKKLSTQLATSQDFTTLYTLYKYASSQEYDLIVVDTPPAQHTWDFLSAPEKLKTLFSEEVSSVFRVLKPHSTSLFKKLVLSATDQVLTILEKLTGTDFISELRSFFNLIQKWQDSLNHIINNCQKILMAQSTEFLLVTSFDANQFKTAKEISRKIYNEGFNLKHLIINRVPQWIDETHNTDKDNQEVEKFRNLYLSTMKQIKSDLKISHQNLMVYKSFNLGQNITNDIFIQIYKNITPLI